MSELARTLSLAADLTLPVQAVSRTFGILAVRGAGKSNTAAVMAEEMFAAGLPFCVVDPVGSWFGLRSSADGKRPGLPIPIFGGKHGDVPLERGAGELVADLVVEKRLTCVLDLSRFESEGDKKAFLLAFAKRLYLRNEDPLHLFLEEADDYIPQKPFRDEAQLLRAWENIVRRGRARGLGITLVTQRSASVNKMVLTQVETLFAMRTTGPQDIAAIKGWVQYHQVGTSLLSSLASLDDGEAWVWSPHFLKIVSRHQIRRRHTFDSGATPDNLSAGDRRAPATLADINVESLRQQMAAMADRSVKGKPAKKAMTQEAHVTNEEAARLTRENEQLKADNARLTATITNLETRLQALEGQTDDTHRTPVGRSAAPADRAPARATGDRPPPRSAEAVFAGDDEARYQAIKARLFEEAATDPRLLKILMTQPELVVEIQRETIVADGTSGDGWIGRLIADGWLDDVRAGNAIFEELKRRGASVAKPTAYNWSDNMVKKGFLSKERDGYRAVAGMKVRIVERAA